MKDQYVAAKERWARKRAGQARPAARSTNRLPPGQREVHNFPVLDLGIKSYDGYSTNNPLDVCLDDDVLIAHQWNGKPLPKEHGGPARVVIPKRYAWKGAKFIREIVFLDRDILGFWEMRGYSNTADPWTEDRFS